MIKKIVIALLALFLLPIGLSAQNLRGGGKGLPDGIRVSAGVIIFESPLDSARFDIPVDINETLTVDALVSPSLTITRATLDSFKVYPSSGEHLVVDENNAEVFVIDATGQVAIGQATANNWLEVIDLVSFNNTLRSTELGYQAGDAQVSGTDNTFVGYQAGLVSTGNYNTAIGQGALINITTEDLLTAVGHQAGAANITGTALAAFGASAGYSSTGDNNTYLGTEAGYYPTTGASNTYVGAAAGRGILGADGGFNVAVGHQALSEHDGSGSTVAVGYAVLQRSISANQQTSVGAYSGFYNETGHLNTLLGFYAGYGSSGNSHDQNTFVGARAGVAISTGDNNIAIGLRAGDELTTGSNNIVIGYDIDVPTASSSNTLNIGNLLFGTGVDGADVAISSGNIGIRTSSPDAPLEVETTGALGIDVVFGVVSDNSLNFNLRSNWDGATAGGGDWSLIAHKDSSFRIHDINADVLRFIIDLNGNIGVATAAPNDRLTVAGVTTGNGFIVTAENVPAGTDSSVTIDVTSDGDGRVTWYARDGDVSYLYPNNNGFMVLNTNGTDRIFFGPSDDSAFRVGASTGQAIAVREVSSSTNPIWTYADSDGDEDSGVGFTDPDILHLITSGATGLTIDASQQIGIGTVVPSQLVTVKTAASDGLLITGEATPAGTDSSIFISLGISGQPKFEYFGTDGDALGDSMTVSDARVFFGGAAIHGFQITDSSLLMRGTSTNASSIGLTVHATGIVGQSDVALDISSGATGQNINLRSGSGGTIKFNTTNTLVNVFEDFQVSEGGTGVFNLGATGVKLTDDADGAITFLGLGDGFDESLTLNLDDVENEVTITSATGLVTANFSSIVVAALGFTIGSAAILEAELEILDGATPTTTEFNLLSGLTVLSGSNTGDELAASVTVVGVSELATAAETTTGTDATRALTPDGFAGSDYGKKNIQILAFDFTVDTAVGDGAFYFVIAENMGGMDLVAVHAEVITAGTTNTTDIQIVNVTQAAVDMLSTVITIDSGETGSDTAAAAAVIDGTNDDVADFDVLRVDVDAVSTTAAKGLIVTMVFQLP